MKCVLRYETRCFISYKRLDKDKVFKIKDFIERKTGHKCWIDLDGIESDAQFANVIIRAINDCELFLFMYSHNHTEIIDYENDWTVREINFAQDKKKRIVFLNIDNTPLTDWFKLIFGTKQQVDASSDFAMNKLCVDIVGWLKTGVETDMRNIKGALIRIETDLDCRIIRFKEELAVAKSGDITEIRLPKGKHKLTFEGLECKDDSYSTIYEVNDLDYEDYIEVNLLEKHNARKAEFAKAEQERIKKERREAEERRLEEEAKAKAEQERLEKERREAEERRLEEEAKAKAEQERLEKERREAEEKRRKELERSQLFEVNGVSFAMIKVEGGTFNMGAQKDYPDRINYDSEALNNYEFPVHSVTLSDYYIGETEVTQELWQAVMGNNPSYFKGSQRPVELVSWNDCQNFIKKLNKLMGKNFRLPTEAEWEYAARGGNKSKGYKYSGIDTIGDVAWYDDNSGDQTHNVKTKSPNELGIYDMSGNVYEWCHDWWGGYNSGSQTNPTGLSSGSNRVFRGGGWIDFASFCRVSYRLNLNPDNRSHDLGLRLAL